MVVLTPRFTLLAALSTLATVCLVPSANAAAVARDSVSIHAHAGVTVSHTQARRSATPTTRKSIHVSVGASVHHAPPPRSVIIGALTSAIGEATAIPLGGGSGAQKKRSRNGADHAENSSNKAASPSRSNGSVEKRWDPFGNLLEIGGLCLGDSCPGSVAETTTTSMSSAEVREAPALLFKDHRNGQYRYKVIQYVTHSSHYQKRSNIEESKTITENTQESLLTFNVPKKRQFALTLGVPGSVEIVSHIANSKYGQRIASLVLSTDMSNGTASNGTSNGTGSDVSPSTFVLDASPTDRTQVYLVALPASNTTNSTDSGSGPSSSDSSSYSNSSSSSNSTDSFHPTFIKVALQMPIFDATTAQMMAYCATFDAHPETPSPLTVETCRDPTQKSAHNGTHKSQVFAYEPNTGIVRPMWFANEDDGMSPDDDADAGNGSSSNTTLSANTTTSVPPSTPSTSGVVSVLSAGRLGNVFDAVAQKAKSYDAIMRAHSLATAQNVTLLFVPAAPVVEDVAAVSDTATSTGTDSTTDTATDSVASTRSSDFSSATVTFSTLAADSSAKAYAQAVAALDVTDTETATDYITSTVYYTATGSASTVYHTITESAQRPRRTSSTPVVRSSSTDSASSSVTFDANSEPTATGAAYAVEVQEPAPDAQVSASASPPVAAPSPPGSAPSPPVSAPASAPAPPVSAPASAPAPPSSAPAPPARPSAPVHPPVAPPASASASIGAFALDVTLSAIQATATDAGSATAADVASDSTMTAVSTAPYAWMFREGTVDRTKDVRRRKM